MSPAARTTYLLIVAATCLLSPDSPRFSRAEEGPPARPAEEVYHGDMIAFPGPWGFMPRSAIILVSDQELETLANDPD